MSKYTIYGLLVNDSDNFFYVGVTKDHIDSRKKAHIRESRRKSESINAKVSVIVDCNYMITAKEIEVVSSKWEASKREAFWIEKLLDEGHPLTNIVRTESYGNGGLCILNQQLSTMFNWRTTIGIMTALRKEAGERFISVNTMINQIMYERYFKTKKK